MADIRQNTDVTGKLTIEGGGASTPFEVQGSSDSGVSSYTQFKLTDQNTGVLLELFNQAGTSEFSVSTSGTTIGGSYVLPHDAPGINQILTRATGAGVGVLSWEDNVADAGTIGGEPVSISTLGANNLLQYNGSAWVNVTPVTPATPNLSQVVTAGSSTDDAITVGGITVDEVTYDGADGTAGQVLTTDGSGTLSFEDAAIDLVAIDVHNDSGATIARGLPVYVSGTHASGKPTIALADNDASGTMPCIGLVQASISNNTDGTVIVSGMQRNLNTSSFSAGDALYVGTTAGTLTATRPIAVTSQVQKVGIVTRSHASTGEILVMGAGRVNDIPNDVEINDISDIDTAGFGDGDVLVYRTLDGAWVPEALPSSGASELNGLSDVTISTGADGEVLAHNGSGFVNSSLATEVGAHVSTGNLSDVTSAAPANNDVLLYDSGDGEWVHEGFTLDNIITASGNLTTQYLIVNNATGVISTGGITASAGNINASTGSIIAGGFVQGTASASAPGIQGLTSTTENAGVLCKSSISNPNADATVGLELQLATLNQTDNEFIPSISFTARDDNNDAFEAANIYTYVTDVSAGSEDAMLCIKTVEAGTVQIAAEFNGGLKIYNHDETGQPNDDLVIYNPTTSPATDDATGTIVMRGKNSANADTDFVKFIGGVSDVTSGSEEGAAVFAVMNGGTMTEVLEFSYLDGINFYNNKYAFPDATPTAGQVLVANASNPSNLEWGSAGGGNKVYFSKMGKGTLATPTNRWYGDASEGAMEDFQSTHSSAIDPGTINGAVDNYFHNGFVAPFDFTNVRVVGMLANAGDADLNTNDLTLELWRIHSLTSGTDNGSISLMGSTTQTFNSDTNAVFSIDFDCTSNLPEDGDAFFITFTSQDSTSAIAFKFNLTFECT